MKLKLVWYLGRGLLLPWKCAILVHAHQCAIMATVVFAKLLHICKHF